MSLAGPSTSSTKLSNVIYIDSDTESEDGDRDVKITVQSRQETSETSIASSAAGVPNRKGKGVARSVANAPSKSTATLAPGSVDNGINLLDGDDIQLIEKIPPAKPTEIIDLDSLPQEAASPIHDFPEPVDYDEDFELARRLDEEERREYEKLRSLPDDHHHTDADLALAAELEQQEKEEYDKFVESIANKNDGIVFSVAISADSNTHDDGSPAHPDDIERFLPWRQLFEKTAPGCKIKKFHWFVNPLLEKRFEDARAILGMLDRPIDEEMLFHGTKEANVESILQVGLRIGGTHGVPITNGAAFGRGIYLTTSAITAVGYAAGASKIFACRVILGEQTKIPQQEVPRLQPGAEEFDCYNGGNGVYVSRCADLVLPCYMIEFENPQANLYGQGLFQMPAMNGLLPLPGRPLMTRNARYQMPVPVVPPPKPKKRRAEDGEEKPKKRMKRQRR